MSLYRSRWSRFPRPVSPEDSRRGRTRTLAGLGQPPTVKDVINSYPMPVLPDTTDFQDPLLSPSPSQSGPQITRDLPVWLYPPRNWENIDQLAYALLPAIGSTQTILSYLVPIGRNGVINKVACNFVGGGWTAGTGDVVWRILVDGTPPPGATSYDNITDSLGSPAQPVGISGFRIFENQTLTVVVFNNPAGANGGVVVAGQRAGARVLGHLYPRDSEIEDLWI
jgi:hypothetical protein